MSFDYINEAFKRLDALNEDMFDTSLNGLNSLSDFMEQDDASDIVKVIDPTAETENDLSDSYVGKVIINCNVCHSHIFESKEDVVIDEDGIVNPEMQCPYCGEMSGFTVVGEIAPFEQEPEEDDEAEDSFEDSQDSFEDEEDSEDPADDSEEDKKDLEESFDSYPDIEDGFQQIKNFLNSKGYSCASKESITYIWSVVDLFDAGGVEINDATLNDWYQETCRNYPEDLELFESFDEGLLGDVNVNVDARGFGGKDNNVSVLGGKLPGRTQEEGLIGNAIGSFVGTAAANAMIEEDEVDESLVGSAVSAFTKKAVGNMFEETDVDDRNDSVELTEGIFDAFKKKSSNTQNTTTSSETSAEADRRLNQQKQHTWVVVEFVDNDGKIKILDKTPYDDAGSAELAARKLRKGHPNPSAIKPMTVAVAEARSGETLMESIDELSLTANGTHIEVDEDENGKVTLVAEPVADEAGTDEISPVSDETMQEIEANNDVETDSGIDASEEEIDLELDEVDEEGMDELGESYLKRIYENVKSFKTRSISGTDSRMVVEGVITFASGVKKNTGFVFEAHSASRDGRVKFVGKNEHLSKNGKAFALTGKIKNSKLLPESLSYNYTVGSKHISGTVRKR